MSAGEASGPADDSECAGLLAEVRPWQHELAFYRNAQFQWGGPIIGVEYSSNNVVLRARDLFEWMERRVLPYDREVTGEDLALLFEQLVIDALYNDQTPNLSLEVTASQVHGSRRILASEHRIAADELRELSRNAVDFTVIGRTLYAGATTGSPIKDALTDSSVTDVRFIDDGLATATKMYLKGQSGGAGQLQSFGADTAQISAEAGGTDDNLGLVEKVASDLNIRDQASAQLGAAERLLAGDGRSLRVTLSTQGPDMDKLIPGSTIPVGLTVGAKVVTGTYLLLKVGVTCETDQVTLDLMPV